MAVDRAQLTASLHSFYDFGGKVVLCVGGGHGQLLDPKILTAETVLIDRDEKSLTETHAKHGRVRAIVADFKDVNAQGDVVYFEFCLHEMGEPREGIEHAKELAPDVVIFEHSPGSEWVFYAAEEDGVCRSAQALAQFPIKRRQNVHVEQIFKDYAELVAKLAAQGDLAVQRAAHFADVTNIVIPMKCDLVLL